jgi:hypothetical protein
MAAEEHRASDLTHDAIKSDCSGFLFRLAGRRLNSRETLKLSPQSADLFEIGRGIVIPAPLAGHHLKTTVSKVLGRTSTTEMNEGGEILFLLSRRL